MQKRNGFREREEEEAMAAAAAAVKRKVNHPNASGVRNEGVRRAKRRDIGKKKLNGDRKKRHDKC